MATVPASPSRGDVGANMLAGIKTLLRVALSRKSSWDCSSNPAERSVPYRLEDTTKSCTL